MHEHGYLKMSIITLLAEYVRVIVGQRLVSSCAVIAGGARFLTSILHTTETFFQTRVK